MRRILFSLLAIGILVLPASAAMAGPGGRHHHGPGRHHRTWRHVPPRHIHPIPRRYAYYNRYVPAVAVYPPYYGGFGYYSPGFSFQFGF